MLARRLILCWICCLTPVVFTPSAEPARAEPRLGRGKLLISSARLSDPNFSETVVLLLRHGKSGAKGVIVNRASPIPLNRVLPEIDELESVESHLFLGGPVGRSSVTLLIRSDTPVPETRGIIDGLLFGHNADALRSVAGTETEFRVYAGFAGWAPGQLENEVARGDWHIVNGTAEKVFHPNPAAMWRLLSPEEQVNWTRGPAPRDYFFRLKSPITAPEIKLVKKVPTRPGIA